MMYALDQVAVLSFLGLLAWAAASDAVRFIIPNRVCAAIVLLYPVHVLTSAAPVPWISSTIIAAAIMLIGVFVFSRGWAGGGDVKLFAASALWAGPVMLSPFFLVTAAAGGLLAVGALILTSVAKWRTARPQGAADTEFAGDGAMARPVLPYGVAIAVGGAFVAVQLLRG